MQVVWFPRAEKQWQQAMDYCEDTFGTLVADEFQEEVMRITRLLADIISLARTFVIPGLPRDLPS